jgi:subtilisin family serine protease
MTVAVLDTGVNPFHPDLDGKVFPVFVNPEARGYLDELGHGTHVIGIINGRVCATSTSASRRTHA